MQTKATRSEMRDDTEGQLFGGYLRVGGHLATLPPVTSSDADTLAADPSTVPTPAGESGASALVVLRPGELFAGRYVVEALLGRGGMGAVYRVRDGKLDEVVALKLLTLETKSAQERFVSEVKLARRVTHPNVARTHDFGEDGLVRFLTMEYVPGTTLERIIEQRAPMATRPLVELATQITAGLAAAHAAGVVHRDLKPANVLVGDDGRVIITDFGIARATSQESGTRTGTMLGTPHYMAPEQVLGRPTDARSDLYAMGVILYEMACGVLPFESDSVLGAALARVQACPVDPRRHHAVEDPLASLILRCLAREPEGRPASAGELELALRALVGEVDAASEPTPTTLIVETAARPYAAISSWTQSVAVLPFVYRGVAEHGYLGDAMAEELVDVLSHTRGLRVLSLGATRRFADERDPAAVATALEVDAVVDGVVQHMGDRVRLSVRMIDPDGTQRWAERYDGRLEDVFALQESLGRRVAEALRIELVVAAHRHTAPPEALEHYLRARRMQRQLTQVSNLEVAAMLERAVELAPDFGAALAAHAIASVRAWWGDGETAQGRGAMDRARRSIARAQQQAPELAETHLATAIWEVQSGGFIAAVRALGRALELAPTMAEAHQYLGQIQCEAGRPKEGAEHLELALELDPSLKICWFGLARVAQLQGEESRSLECLAEMWRVMSRPSIGDMIMALRLALYRGDLEDARRIHGLLHDAGTPPALRIHRWTGLVFGETSLEEAEAMHDESLARTSNGRFTMLTRQMATELFTIAGAHELALRELTAAADSALIDLVWLQRCPVLEPLRGDARFLRAEQAVQRRVAAIWR
jgi:TolB-like protein/predicted Ser/Thr protein kinase